MNSVRVNAAVTEWLHSLCPWTLAVTVTHKRKDRRGLPISAGVLMQTARHFLARLNSACFGARRAKRGCTVGFAATYGHGAYGDHPHLHLTIAAPPGVDEKQLAVMVKTAVAQTYWLDRQKKIESYRDIGWIAYVTAHGTDNWIVDLTRPLTPSLG